ncbi:fimbrial protein [Salmonella enterica subsp. enterica]|nr:fimbrial protein [Salmonella enterica subsp. enterica serovar Sangera]EEP4680416.1 fimbrial protein [Salmonella enterica subsp. enterica serovar Sangera]
MNKVMNEENRRRGGRNTLCRLLRSGRWFLCLALLCSAILPGFAGAANSGICTDWNNNPGDMQLKLPASVTIQPGMDEIPPIPPVIVNYKCSSSLPEGPSALPLRTVSIVTLSDVNNLIDVLKELGLTLKIEVTDSSGVTSGPWVFSGKGYSENLLVGAPYSTQTDTGTGTIISTGNRTMTIRARLSRDSSKPTTPGFYAIPSLSAFKLTPYYGTFNGIKMNTPPIRIQYIPKCFVQSRLTRSDVNFGPVLTTDVDSSFSRTIDFKVIADVNRSCNGGILGNLLGGYTPQLSDAKTYYLNLPLKVSFILNNGGAISADNKSIILHKKGTETENGLQLKITDDSGAPVTFGEISTTDGTLPPSANKLGEFTDGNFNTISRPYYAVLSSTGKPVITGSYSAQVTVKVEYY